MPVAGSVPANQGDVLVDTTLVVLIGVAVLAVVVRIISIEGPNGSTARVGRWLGEQGWQVRHLERRWLTRGPFPDIRPAGMRHSGLLYLVAVVGPDGRSRTGWVAIPPRWHWRRTDRWRLQWETEGASAPRGLSTLTYRLWVLAAMAAVLLVAQAVARGDG